MNVSSLMLLYHEPCSLLTTAEIKLKILNIYSFLIKETISALKSFYNKELNKFDPHVGDTACQIRACMFFLLQNDFHLQSQKNIELNKIENLFSLCTHQIYTLTHQINENNSIKNKDIYITKDINTFLKKLGLIIDLPFDIKIIVQSYFLTRFKKKDFDGNSEIDHDKICLEMQVPRKLSKKLVRYYQIEIAKASTQFILNCSNNSQVSNILKYLTYKDDDERPVMPCYLSMKVLFEILLEYQCPILIDVKRFYKEHKIDNLPLLFIPNLNKNGFILKTINYDNHIKLSNKICIIIEGVVNYKTYYLLESTSQFTDRFLNSGLIKIILANMANHPQFTGNKLKHLNNNPYYLPNTTNTNTDEINSNACTESYLVNLREEFSSIKHYGETAGCSYINSSLFLIHHIFCDTIGHHLNSIYKFINFSDIIDYSLLHYDAKVHMEDFTNA